MEKESLKEAIIALIPTAEVVTDRQYPEVLVSPEEYHNTALQLRRNPELAFDYLFDLTGVDLPDCFMVVCHIESTAHRHEIVVKVKTAGREDPRVDTVSDVWTAAEFHEREVYDLMGVRFNNHPDLRRLFLDDDWGFPLRKDYRDDLNIIER
jgi:NADH:ubiquinone oxidoreductase subunit C